MKSFFKIGIGSQILIASVIGVLVGIYLRFFDVGISPSSFKFLGDIFLDLVKMVIVPLIFGAITSAILSIKDLKSLGVKAKKGLILFGITNVVGVSVGLASGYIFKPGIVKGFDAKALVLNDVSKKMVSEAQKYDSIADKILHMIPDNVFKAFYSGDLLQVIFFSIIFGLAAALIRDKIGDKMSNFISDFAQVMYAMIKIVMKFAPFGIFGLAVWIAGSQSVATISVLMKLVFAAFMAILFMVVVFYPAALFLRHGVNPFIFMKKMFPVQLFAFATCSSAASLPMNMKVVSENLGATKESTNLLMPIGTSIDMNGTACHLALYSVFVAQLFGISLGISDYVSIGMICFLSSLGSPPVPGGAVIVLSGVLASLGYPLEAISLIFAIDKLIGPIRTVGNATGEAFAPIYVDLLSKELNKKVYNSKNIA
jgi:Na+/H+-dicarboxylate symporter